MVSNADESVLLRRMNQKASIKANMEHNTTSEWDPKNKRQNMLLVLQDRLVGAQEEFLGGILQ